MQYLIAVHIFLIFSIQAAGINLGGGGGGSGAPKANGAPLKSARQNSLEDINLDTFLKTSNYEDTVKQLDIYYGIGMLICSVKQ